MEETEFFEGIMMRCLYILSVLLQHSADTAMAFGCEGMSLLSKDASLINENLLVRYEDLMLADPNSLLLRAPSPEATPAAESGASCNDDPDHHEVEESHGRSTGLCYLSHEADLFPSLLDQSIRAGETAGIAAADTSGDRSPGTSELLADSSSAPGGWKQQQQAAATAFEGGEQAEQENGSSAQHFCG